MSKSLLSEKPLLLWPTLAATIGLEPALMLQALSERAAAEQSAARTRAAYNPDSHPTVAEPGRAPDSGRLNWFRLGREDMQSLFPFWSWVHIQQVREELKELGMLKMKADPQTPESTWYALEGADAAVPPAAAQSVSYQAAGYGAASAGDAVSVNGGALAGRPALGSPLPGIGNHGQAGLISAHWQPGEEWLKHCLQQGIPQDFVQGLVSEFVSYWREVGEARRSWGSIFCRHALNRWREEQTRQGGAENLQTMSKGWKPSADALEILLNGGIARNFIEDAIPEFILYWSQKGVASDEWDTRFIGHIRRQWARYSLSFGKDNAPQLIPEDWMPSAACFEILHLSKIDEDYARDKIPEFILYWRDRKEARESWDTVFLMFIKQVWARLLQSGGEPGNHHYGEDQSSAGARERRIEARLHRYADRSWAE